MKAKNWKKFVPGDKPKDTAQKKSALPSTEPDEKEKESLLNRLVSENDTLSRLMEERKKLEQEMAALTGKPVTSDFARNFHFADIPSISEKKKEEKQREQERAQKLQALKLRRSLTESPQEDLSEPKLSGLSDMSASAPQDIIGKRNTPSDSRVKDALRDLDSRRKRYEKVEKDIRTTSDKIQRTKSDLKNAKDQLDRFASELDRLSSDPNVKDALGDIGVSKLTGLSKFTDKLDKPLSSAKTNKSAQSFVERWDKIKDKQLSVDKLKDKYKEMSDRILKVKVGSLTEIGAKRDKLQKALAEKKKRDREAERNREEQRDEQLENRREERKEEEKWEAQREDQRETRVEQKKQEERQEQEREKRLEDRKAARRKDQREQRRDERRKERRSQIRNEKY